MKNRSPSLTAQLGALFALLALTVFSAMGLYLYQSLALQLQDRDDADLIDRMAQIRHLLGETPSLDSIRTDPHRFLDAVDHGLLLKMRTRDGQLLLQNTRHSPLVGPVAGLPSGAEPSSADTGAAVLADGRNVRYLMAFGAIGGGMDEVQVVLARTADARVAVLNAYRFKVWMAALAGALLTAGLGYLLVRRKLHKAANLAAQARLVSASNLHRRLDIRPAPAELQAMADSFNEVLERLQSSFSKLSQFADDLAHDLRTPLNNLMIQTEVVLSQARSVEEYQALITSNHEEFARLARMVDSMLFLARADHDQIALTPVKLEAAQELAVIADYFEGIAADANVVLAVDATGSVWADSVLLRRAVGNLVANAIRYTPGGGRIVLSARTLAAGTTISVTNPGPTIDASHLPRLFDRFYRSDQSRSSESHSAGLGLAIVQSIMALHGGLASVTSERSSGTRFELYFPTPVR